MLGRTIFTGEEGGGHMMKKLLTLLFTSVLAFPLSTLAVAQETPAQDKSTKQDRWALSLGAIRINLR